MTVLEVTANFVQAREYYTNASRSDISVKPLLLYYGVLALCRGLILYCSTAKGPEALKPSHGLKAVDWGGTLAKGTGHFHELTTSIESGTLNELIEATVNKAYFKQNSSEINWTITYPRPPIGTSFTFQDIILGFADLRTEYSVWSNKAFPSIQIAALTVVEPTRVKITFQNGTTQEQVRQFYVTAYDDIETGKNGTQVWALLPAGKYPCVSQSMFKGIGDGIGDIHMIPPIGNSFYLNPLSLFYAGSYILGMTVRYFPSAWLNLARQGKGDRIFPLIMRLMSLIENDLPEVVLQYLEAPHHFEKKTEKK